MSNQFQHFTVLNLQQHVRINICVLPGFPAQPSHCVKWKHLQILIDGLEVYLSSSVKLTIAQIVEKYSTSIISFAIFNCNPFTLFSKIPVSPQLLVEQILRQLLTHEQTMLEVPCYRSTLGLKIKKIFCLKQNNVK